jgi:hypothetical protein
MDRLTGGRGVPTVIARDRGSREVELERERHAKHADQAQAAVGEIQRAEAIRRHAPTIPLEELRTSLRAFNAERAEQERQAQDATTDLEDLEAWAQTATHAGVLAGTRRGKALSPAEIAYEQAELAAHFARPARPVGCGRCSRCAIGEVCVYDLR